MSNQYPIIISGMGGQGVQLAAQVLCRAAVLEGRQAQYFSFVGGVMRGGMSSAYVVVADGPVEVPPLFGLAWAGIPLHREYEAVVLDHVHADSVVVVDPSMVDAADSPARVVSVPSRQIARDCASRGAESLIAVAALAGTTELVRVESLVEAMRASLPPYRQDRAEANERAIAGGYSIGHNPAEVV